MQVVPITRIGSPFHSMFVRLKSNTSFLSPFLIVTTPLPWVEAKYGLSKTFSG